MLVTASWDALKQLPPHIFPRYHDQWAERRAEIEALVPRPSCCGMVAKTEAIYAAFLIGEGPGSEKPEALPRWFLDVRAFGGGYMVSVAVHHCPFCGTELPDLELRETPPEHVQRFVPLESSGLDPDNYEEDVETVCLECERASCCCFCDPPVNLWKVQT